MARSKIPNEVAGPVTATARPTITADEEKKAAEDRAAIIDANREKLIPRMKSVRFHVVGSYRVDIPGRKYMHIRGDRHNNWNFQTSDKVVIEAMDAAGFARDE